VIGMAQETKFFAAGGGLDLITPAIEIPNGAVIAANNYEAHLRGYQRVDGYERFDGQQKPSTASYWVLNFDAGSAAVNEGDTVTGETSGATGSALIDAVVESGSYGGSDADGYIVLTNVTRTFADDENLQVASVTKSVMDGTAVKRGAATDANDDTWLQDAMETARSAIGAVPGSGNIRGIKAYKGDTYVFRDNAAATFVDMYKSTTSGWTLQTLGRRLEFTSGGTTEISEGDVITGATSGATATTTRVALHSGSWAAGDAAGYFIFDSQSGTFEAEDIDVGASGNLATIAADSVANTLATRANSRTTEAGDTRITEDGDTRITEQTASGRLDFENHNFGGHAETERMYGCDGVSMAFEWDGNVFVPIKTGMTSDTPIHLAVHKQHLFLAFTGGSLQHSGLGLPYQFTLVTGASEMGIGEEITGLHSDVEGFLVIGGRNKISILYGQDTDNWELVDWSDESGVVEWSMDKLGSIMFLDDIGVRRLSTARDYGNFKLATLSQKIEPIFRRKRNDSVAAIASLRTRSKDMYRLFFDDGTGISIHFGRGPKKPECMTFTLPLVVHCTCSGEDRQGDEILFFGSTDGYVYEIDAGPNHDGAEITAYIRFPFNHVGSPTRNKQWFKAVLEVDADDSAALDITAEFDYGHTDQPAMETESFTVESSGGFWEENEWADFAFTKPVEGLAEAPIDGYGKNVSVKGLSAGTYDNAHKIHGLHLYYSMRRLAA
tara:strand:+ start:15346 stop:17514 length:2169 start_codon:yes stop_codon:yes gene_type:complete